MHIIAQIVMWDVFTGKEKKRQIDQLDNYK